MTTKISSLGVAAALALLVPMGACSKDSAAESGKQRADETIATAIGGASNLGTVSEALSQSGLAGVFDGPGSYTVLAPDDDAFAKLGAQEKDLTDVEHRAELVALLRGHILPGHVTPDAIRKAIAAKKGPVTMRTLADSEVTFSESGKALVVTGADGSKAQIDGKPLVATNGIVLPLDGLVKKPVPAPAG